jgi:hypothetical protein
MVICKYDKKRLRYHVVTAVLSDTRKTGNQKYSITQTYTVYMMETIPPPPPHYWNMSL